MAGAGVEGSRGASCPGSPPVGLATRGFPLRAGAEREIRRMIDKELLEILVCPENRTPLRPADEALVGRLNEAVAGGGLRNRVGQPVTSRVEEGLVREDGALFYPIVEGIPVLLIDEAIPLDQVEPP